MYKFKKYISRFLAVMTAAIIIAASVQVPPVIADEPETVMQTETETVTEETLISETEPETQIEESSGEEETSLEAETETEEHSEAETAAEEISAEEERETETEETSEEESTAEEVSEEETAGEEMDIYETDDTDPGILEGLDFSSMRLIAGTSDEDIFADKDVVISSYNGVYLLQFEDADTAKMAYMFYYDKADFVEVDTGMSIAEGEAAENVSTDTFMTEDDNPLDAITENGDVGSFDIALIDTGAAGADESVSMIGENTADDNGHGSAMLEYIAEQAPKARILSIKALGADGRGDVSAVYAAIEYAISQDVRIINLSMSALAFKDSTVIEDAVNEAVAAGIIVVGAAGNNGRDAGYYVPGYIGSAYIIGAASETGVKLARSNFGASVDYNVAADSTSEAAARFSGFIAAYGIREVENVLNKGLIFATDFAPAEEEEEETDGIHTATLIRPGEFSAAIGTSDTLYGVDYPAYVSLSMFGNYMHAEKYYAESDGTQLYCIEPGHTFANGATYSAMTPEELREFDSDHTTDWALNFLAKGKYVLEHYSWYEDITDTERTMLYQTFIWFYVNNGFSNPDRTGLRYTFVSDDAPDFASHHDTFITDMAAVRAGTYTGNIPNIVNLKVTGYSTGNAADQTLITISFDTSTPAPGDVTFKIERELVPGNVTVEKVLKSGSNLDPDKEYSFIYQTASSGSNWGESVSFTLRAEQSFTFGVPAGYSWRVEETDYSADNIQTRVTGDGGNTWTSGRVITGTMENNTTDLFPIWFATSSRNKEVDALNTDTGEYYHLTHNTVSNLPSGTYTINEGIDVDKNYRLMPNDVDGWEHKCTKNVDIWNGNETIFARTQEGEAADIGAIKYSFKPEDQGTNGEFRFENGQDAGNLSITKTVTEGTASLTVKKEVKNCYNESQKFDMRLTITKPDGSAETRYTGVHNGVTFTNGVATFQLGRDETKTFTDIPAGDRYSFTEVNVPAGYAVETNLPVTGTLGSTAQYDGNFDFRVTLYTDANRTSVASNISGTYGDVTFSSGVANFAMRTGTKNITGLPAGLYYKAEETNDHGYTSSISNATGSIPAGSTASVTASNSLDGSTDSKTIVNKALLDPVGILLTKVDENGTDSDRKLYGC